MSVRFSRLTKLAPKMLVGSSGVLLTLCVSFLLLRTPQSYATERKTNITFTKDIAPILFANCAPCHRPGEVAPFTLLTYQDAKKRASQLAAVTQSRYMPPWKADPAYGKYHDARYLTDAQIALLKQWAEEGAKEGNPADLPPAPKFTYGWTLGPPDTVITPAEDYQLEAEGKDVYRNFVIPTSYAEDRHISAIDVRPGNRAVVHHVIAYLDTSGTARKLDAKDPGPGYSTSGGGVGFLPAGFLGGWAPGNLPRHLPDGIGIPLPKGADIVLQVHYHKSGKPETDRTRVGLYFSKKPVDKHLHTFPLAQIFLRIPAGEASYQTQTAFPVPVDVTILRVMPHMHLLGKEMTVTATLPDGKEQRLVRVPDWDFNWQTTYEFQEPIRLPKGSRVQLTARYDNSEQNPRNPHNPPRTVTWGEETTDEMCLAFLFFTIDAEQLTEGKAVAGFGRFSGNQRGRLRELLLRQR